MTEPIYYRTQSDARSLLPAAMRYPHEVESRLPRGQFDFARETLFVGRTVPREVGCIAVGLIGLPGHLTALEFNLADDPHVYVDALLRYRERCERAHP